MIENDEKPKIRRSRGKGFPVMPLDQAVSAASKAGRYGREHSLDDYAEMLGHTTSNSGPFRRKMAALKDWGLISRDGDVVKLTDLALRIASPESDEDLREALKSAFFKEPLFKSLYDDAEKETDLSLAFLGGRAVNAYGVAPVSKDRFAASFAQSVEAAGLGRRNGEESIVLTSGASPVEEPQHGEPATDDEDLNAIAEPRRRSSSLSEPTLKQEWKVRGGALVFEAFLDRPLPPSAYAQVGEIAAAVEALSARLGAVETETGDPEE